MNNENNTNQTNEQNVVSNINVVNGDNVIELVIFSNSASKIQQLKEKDKVRKPCL